MKCPTRLHLRWPAEDAAAWRTAVPVAGHTSFVVDRQGIDRWPPVRLAPLSYLLQEMPNSPRQKWNVGLVAKRSIRDQAGV
jgi:hypothetical protein